jgi:hypothetical protein
MRRFLPLASLATCLLGAFPAHGAAALRSPGILEAGPFAVNSYKMYLLAIPSFAGTPAYLVVRFDRGTATDLQEHFYGFGKGVRVSIARNGEAATLKANLGVFGRINMSLAATARGRVPIPCSSARVTGYKGSLSGTFRLVMHNPALEGTAHPSRLNASIVTATASTISACAAAPSAPSEGTQLSVTSQLSPTMLATFTDTRPTSGPGVGATIEDALVQDSTYLIDNDVTIDDEIEASTLPRDDLTSASDFSSASAVAGGRFMSGGLAYTASTPASGSMPSRGSVSGSLTVNFDGLSPITFPSGTYTSATLGNGQL